MNYTLHHGDCLDVLRTLPDNSVDAVVTDPPYGLSFMGKRWDYDVPSEDVWRECLRVLKPGGHLLAFAGTRTQHRMAVRIEDAGFEIRDMIAWVYGSGFPKSLDVSKAIDKAAPRAGMFNAFTAHFAEKLKASGKTQKEVASLFPSKTGGLTGCVWNWANGANVPTLAQWNVLQPLLGLSLEWLPLIERMEAERKVVGQKDSNLLAVAPGQDNDRSSTTINITAPATPAARQWHGWGTALKPALEPITVARKPLIGTVAENVLTWGTGGVNVDGCRVGTEEIVSLKGLGQNANMNDDNWKGIGKRPAPTVSIGRWPANLILDEEAAQMLDEQSGWSVSTNTPRNRVKIDTFFKGKKRMDTAHHSDSGGASRFFYCAKASKRDRDDGCEGMEAKAAGALNMRTDSHAIANNMNTRPRTNHHPTVKPTDLMRYLCRLVTPPNGIVLDPFMGSGSTGKAAMLEGFQFIGIEREAEYLDIARARIEHAINNKPNRLL